MKFLFSLLLFTAVLNLKAQKDKEELACLGYDTIQYNYVVLGDTVEAVFYIVNTSAHTIPIWQVHPGCQCTVPVYPDSLSPFRTDSVVLAFYSAHTPPGYFEKGAIVLNPLGERNLLLTGTITKPQPKGRKPRKYRIYNTRLYKEDVALLLQK
ncbi:MAG: DUF1573 domain-containing protein [Bacteroidetes bacterium]|nr:DUF1573 domain-containing protein [Bacteroidota bacterium]